MARVRAIWTRGLPASSRAWTAAMVSSVRPGRPGCRPAARAAATPAVRSAAMARSNSVTAPKTWKISRPPAVLVSMASVRERSSMPRSWGRWRR